MLSAKTLGAVYTHTHTGISLKKSRKTLSLVLIQKIYIKYKNLKDGLCIKIARPFCVQKWVLDTS